MNHATDFHYVAEQLARVRQAVRQTAEQSGRPADAVELLAVSKTFPVEAILAAYQAGQRRFGESRIQELELKTAVLPDDIEWHLIGHLQSNKAAKAVEYAHWIHSVDSLKLLERLDRLAGDLGRQPNILLEVNLSGEASKFGIDSHALDDLAAGAAAAGNLRWQGLMTMAPAMAARHELHRIFSALRQRRDQLEQRFQQALPVLSMGMSGDYPAAIAEGATIVRIGSAIFGARDYS